MHKRKTIALLLILCGTTSMMLGQNEYELLFLQKDYDKIIELSKPPETPDAYYWQAMALAQTGMIEKGRDLLQEALEMFPGDEKLEMLFAELLYNLDDYAAAKPLLEKYKAQHETFMQLIRVLEFQSKSSEAIALLNERIQTDSMNIETIGRLADNYYQVDSLEKALMLYKKLSGLNPRDQVALLRQANILLQMQMYKASIKVCDSALYIDSTNLTIQRIKAIASFRDSDFKTAARIFQFLLAEGDSSKSTLKHLGISEIKNYNFHDARKHLLIGFQLDSNDHEISFFLGRAFQNSVMPDSGLYYMDRAESLLQPDPEVLATIYTEKASINNMLEAYEQALQNYEKAYAISPKPAYLFNMASLFRYRLDNDPAALKYYTRFLEELPPVDENEKQTLKTQGTISMKKIALESVTELREKLFFEGELEEQKQ